MSDAPWGTITAPRGNTAAEAAVNEAISTLVYIGITVAVSMAVLKRDAVTRAWTRITRRRPSAAKIRERRLLAELRRDVALIEHGDHSPARPPRGLYETETKP